MGQFIEQNWAYILAFSGAGWAVWTYWTSAWIEARKPFLLKQLDYCTEAAQAAAQIATTKDREVFERASATFWELYWGRLAIVEDAALEAAMVRFGKALPRYGFGSKRIVLGELSLQIAHAGRNLIKKSWSIELGPLSVKLQEN